MASSYPPPLGLIGASSLLSITTFASSLSQRNEHWQYHIPVVLGFFITIIYHISTFIDTRKPVAATIDPSLLATNAVAFYCLLLTLWMIIFMINLVLCVATESRLPRLVVLSTIAAGLECIVLGRLAVKYDNAALNALYENPALRGQQGESDRESQGPYPNAPSSRPENLIYLLSLALATFSLVFAIYPQFLFVYANVAAFAITVPYHIALFLSQRLPAHRRRGPWSFVLFGIWIFVVAIDMLAGAPHSALPFQIVVSTVFGGLECVVVGFIAFRCVGDDSSVDEGQVQLPYASPIVVYR